MQLKGVELNLEIFQIDWRLKTVVSYFSVPFFQILLVCDEFQCECLYSSCCLHHSVYAGDKWSPPSLSEVNPIIFNFELTHLGSEASKLLS